MATDSYDDERWYQALFEEDSYAVMQLLDAHPSLLKMGWDSQTSMKVAGRRRRERTGQTQSSWKGRTALHVGASRGCVRLILQVLGLCNVHGYPEIYAAYQSTLLDQTGANPHSNSDEEGHGQANTIASTSSNPTAIQKIPGPSVPAENNRAIIADVSGDVSKSKEIVVEPAAGQLEVANSSEVDESKGAVVKIAETLSLVAGDKGSPAAQMSSGRPKSQNTLRAVNQDATTGKFISGVDFSRLLLAKDGESGLDALAIAAICGRSDVTSLLRYGLEQCNIDDHSYTFSSSSQSITDVFKILAEENRMEREQLRQVTVAAAMAFIKIVEPSYFNRRGDESDDSDELPEDSADADAILEAFETTLHDPSTIQSFSSTKDLRNHAVFKDYFAHRDFNFLPPEEYLFHFLCADENNLGEVGFVKASLYSYEGPSKTRNGMLLTLWTAVSAWQGGDLWKVLLQLKDGQGRSPFHVAVDESTEDNVLQVLSRSNKRVNRKEARNMLVLLTTAEDQWGRTPAHRAAATDRPAAIQRLLELAIRHVEVSVACHRPYAVRDFDDGGVSRNAGFPLRFPLPQTPLHAALIHKNFSCAERLLVDRNNWSVGPLPSSRHIPYRSSDQAVCTQTEAVARRRTGAEGTGARRGVYERMEWIEWDIVELAFLVGAPASFMKHLKHELSKPRPTYKRWKARIAEEPLGWFYSPGTIYEYSLQPLHLAASLGRYDLVELLVDTHGYDVLSEDFEGNTALHHALDGRQIGLHTHLRDFFHFEHCCLSKHNKGAWGAKEEVVDDTIAERQGCIIRLLQAGCDIFKWNHSKQIPYPRGSLKNKEFLLWWYAKQEKEFTSTQNNLNFATNAIAVTATLVATASYIGPLQPPMGYDANQIQYANVWVSIFIVCDALSFYLAIVAITLSLIPSLPMPQQAMREELDRTRGMVIMAVGILLPAIFFIFVAFASSTISIMNVTITSEIGGIFTIVSTTIGVVLCIFAFMLFFVRLAAFVYPKNNNVRYLHDLSDHVTKFFAEKEHPH